MKNTKKEIKQTAPKATAPKKIGRPKKVTPSIKPKLGRPKKVVKDEGACWFEEVALNNSSSPALVMLLQRSLSLAIGIQSELIKRLAKLEGGKK